MVWQPALCLRSGQDSAGAPALQRSELPNPFSPSAEICQAPSLLRGDFVSPFGEAEGSLGFVWKLCAGGGGKETGPDQQPGAAGVVLPGDETRTGLNWDPTSPSLQGDLLF